MTSYLKVHRYPEYLGATPGQLIFNDLVIAYTLELPWRDNLSEISCIPTGIYAIELTYSSKFNKITPEILDVPNRTGVRIHAGNFVSEILGCIIVGSNLVFSDRQLMLQNSRMSFVNLLNRLLDRKIRQIQIQNP